MHGLDAVIFPAYRFADEFLGGPQPSNAVAQATDRLILQTWKRLSAKGIRVIVPGDVPGMRPTSDPECIAQSRRSNDPCAVDRSAVVHPSRTSTLAIQHPDLATEIPLTRYFCDAHSCHGLIGGVVVYFDSHHLTDTYSRSLARYLGASVAAALPPRRQPAA
jgi:hypothetical protein